MNTSKKIKVVVSEKLTTQITNLHKEIGSCEWSGVLLYSVESGSIEDDSELILKAQELWLMDIGTHSYTEINFNSSIMDMYDEIPKADPLNDGNTNPYKIGLIHTHHSMKAFMSGTDKDEIVENSPKHSFYLSLIVNFDGSYVAYVGVAGETETTITRTLKGNSFVQTNKTKDVYIIDCSLEYENCDKINKRVAQIKEEKNSRVVNEKFQFKGFNFNTYEEKNKAKNYISSNQEKRTLPLFERSSPSRLRIIDYLRELVDCGLDEHSKHNTLSAALIDIENSSLTDIRLWEDMVADNYEIMYYEMFPNTIFELDDIVDDVNEILTSFKHFQCTEFLIELICKKDEQIK